MRVQPLPGSVCDRPRKASWHVEQRAHFGIDICTGAGTFSQRFEVVRRLGHLAAGAPDHPELRSIAIRASKRAGSAKLLRNRKGALEQANRLPVGITARRILCSRSQVENRGRVLTAFLEMKSKFGGQLAAPLLARRLQALTDPAVEPHTPRRREFPVKNLAVQGVYELIARRKGAVRPLLEFSASNQVVMPGQRFTAVFYGGRFRFKGAGQGPGRELYAHGAGRFEQCPFVGGQPVQLSCDHLVQAFRDGRTDALERSTELPGSVLADDQTSRQHVPRSH